MLHILSQARQKQSKNRSGIKAKIIYPINDFKLKNLRPKVRIRPCPTFFISVKKCEKVNIWNYYDTINNPLQNAKDPSRNT